jgi:alpha-beta hydrolase superfamily lysophospholipase
MKRFEFGLEVERGGSLFARGWRPDGYPAGTVCIVHGLGEHSGRYDRLAGYLCGLGFSVAALDQRGHGRSGGARGDLPPYATLLDDIDRLLGEARSRWPGVPLFLYGHSMGGNLVINHALKRSPPLAGVVASAPLLRTAFEPPRWKTLLGSLMRRIWPSFGTPIGLNVDHLSRDPAVVRAYREDPLVHGRVSVRFVDVLAAGRWALDHAASCPLPLLVMHGAGDRITAPEASAAFAAAAGERCTFQLWDGFYHELHNDPGHEAVLAYVGDWLSMRCAQTR